MSRTPSSIKTMSQPSHFDSPPARDLGRTNSNSFDGSIGPSQIVAGSNRHDIANAPDENLGLRGGSSAETHLGTLGLDQQLPPSFPPGKEADLVTNGYSERLSMLSSLVLDQIRRCDKEHPRHLDMLEYQRAREPRRPNHLDLESKLYCGFTRERPAILPTRVIDIGLEADVESIQLVESNGQKGDYAALSYCWGTSGTNYLTTMNRLETHKERIPWEPLPETIKDAIRVTWGLGLRYLWIDALCIVQKGELEGENSIHIGEWAVEAGKMASVYQNAYITIAAGSAADCKDGFLKINWDPKTTRFPKNYFMPNGDLGQGVRDVISKIKTSPLYDRAWAFQESVLSSRLLLFMKQELFWVCNDAVVCFTPDNATDFSNMAEDFGRLTPGSAMVHLIWWAWVEDYSSRNIGYASDRLAAIAGAIQYFAQITNDTPLLGLWKRSDFDSFGAGLLWSPKGSAQGLSRTGNVAFSMPNWSWLSIMGGVEYPYVDIMYPRVMFVEFRCDWDGPELTGRLLSADLVVSGRLEAAQVKFDGSDWSIFLLKEGVPHQWRPDVESDCATLRHDASVSCLEVCLQRKTDDLGCRYMSRHVLVLREVDQDTGNRQRSDVMNMAKGINVKDFGQEDKVMGKYERIGIANLGQRPEGSDAFLDEGPKNVIRLV